MYKHIKIFLPLIIAALFCACSADNEPSSGEADPSGASKSIMFGVSRSSLSLDWIAESRSRATEFPPEPVMPQKMGVWAFNNATNTQLTGAGEVFRNTDMYYIYGDLYGSMQQDQSSWAYNLNWEYPNDWAYEIPMPWIPNCDYRFFAYTPFTPYTTYATDSIDVNAHTYDQFNTFVWKHIPRCSARDYMIADQLHQYKSKTSGNPVQELKFMHLQSRLRFCFRLGDKYSELRYIVLKKMQITDKKGCELMLTTTFADEAGILRSNLSWEIEPDYGGDITFTSMTTELAPDNGPLIVDKENTKYKPFASVFVCPEVDLAELVISVEYDVYDLEDHLMRKDETASNTITLDLSNSQSSVVGARKLLPGFFYDINISIEPKFLYNLSDNDVNADGFIVITP